MLRRLNLLMALSLIAVMLPGCIGVAAISGGAAAASASGNTTAAATASTNTTAATTASTETPVTTTVSAETPVTTTASTETPVAVSTTSATTTSASGGSVSGDMGLLKPGVLQVGCEIGYPPFEYFADDGTTAIGFDIDLGDALAQEMGVQIVRDDTAWDGIFAGLSAKKYDCIISAVTMSAERAQTMDFSTPYIENWQSIVVKKGNTPVTSIKGLDGLKVGYQGATTSDEYLNNDINTGVLTCQTFPYDKVLNCFDDLYLGRLDAVLCDSTVADGYISREPDKYEISWLQSSEAGAVAETFGVAIDKGNTQLLNAVDDALKKLKDSGKLDELLKTWF